MEFKMPKNLEERDIIILNKMNNFQLVCGVDECGAGPLAGDLVVAAVILDLNNPIESLNDSKKLSEKKREALFPEIIEKSIDFSIIKISPSEIDDSNILACRIEGFKKAIEALKEVHYALIDGNKIPKDLNIPSDYVIKGDFKFENISAASILAKVTRDNDMKELAKKFPEYGFEKHKGYGTKVHMEALKNHGPCDIHRMSYKPVKESIIIKKDS